MTEDDDLKALMRRADPTTFQAPIDEARIRRVAAAAERDSVTPSARKRPRWLITGVSAGAAVTAAAAVLIAGLVGAPAVQAPGPTGGAITCDAPTAAALRANDTAYEATVTSVEDGVAALRVTATFAGEPGATVDLPQMSDPATGGDLFVVGRAYLVAMTGGFASDCLTGPATDELRQVYVSAFGNGPPRLIRTDPGGLNAQLYQSPLR